MPVPDPPRLNRHGEEIWFKAATGDDGYAPVHRKGWITCLLACAWIVACGTLSMVMIVLWSFDYVSRPVAIIVPFLVLAPAMWITATIVRRHS